MCHVALKKKKKRARVLKMGGKKCRRKTLREKGIVITNKNKTKKRITKAKEEEKEGT